MKKLLFKIFKSSVYKRAVRIKAKQVARVERVKEVVKELRKWDDIPLSWQFTSLCSKLKIKPNEAAKNFLFGLCFGGVDIEKEAKKLPLI